METTPDQPADDNRAITDALTAYFDPRDVKAKPQAVKNNRAMATFYVDARAVMDRLDDVVGCGGWQDGYAVLGDGSVQCELKVRIAGEWVVKTDVGSPSEQPDGGDRLKAAFSDALKRAAVKFGIGRYLYRLPHQWCDYDAAKRAFVTPPQLPDWALPPKKPATGKAPAVNTPPTRATGGEEKKAPPPAGGADMTGPEFHRRLRDADADLANKGLCPLGSLLAHICQCGVRAGYSPNLDEWPKAAIELAAKETRAFKERMAAKPSGGPAANMKH